MINILDKQVSILSVDTGDFYSNEEKRLHDLNQKVRREKKILKEKERKVIDELKEYGVKESSLKDILNYEYDYSVHGYEKGAVSFLTTVYCKLRRWIGFKNKKIKETKTELLELLEAKVEANIKSGGKHHIRKLREDNINDKKIVSVFDSYLTRTIRAEIDEFTDDFMIVTVFFFDVFKDLVYYGYEYKGEKYVYFTSSAGQIRRKRGVFIKESILQKHENTLMCGLTIDKINEQGGCNSNKMLAYTALTTSATDEWKEFDIDKSIVVSDFETDVFGTYDFIDEKDYSISRMDGYVPIPHTDGAGMILPNAFGKEQRNMIIRGVWCKGLLSPFPFDKFVKENNCSPIITDIYGVEHDIFKEDIQVIFTESQYKMHKYMDWETYKKNFKKYGCSFGIANIEPEHISDATINYQMLQSLTDITDDEIKQITKRSNKELKHLCDSVRSIQKVFGATGKNKTYFQKAIEYCPDILNDVFVKEKLKSIKDSLVKRFKAGHLKVKGKYTFVLPDFYASCEYWFKGEKNPKGLLKDGEVFCWLLRDSKELDCLRSPHLDRAHPIRNNVANEEERSEKVREWFGTNGVYTSTHDLISKVLMFDCDGDIILMIYDKTIIEVAKRNMKDIVPLFYHMKKADSIKIDKTSIYNGLINAFNHSNIGLYSNDISKIWNDDVFVNGTEEEQKNAVDYVKCLTAQNNYFIDGAKTLWVPEFPDHLKENIQEYTKKKVPHFFIYAKDKNKNQVEDKVELFVDKLDKIIINPKLNFKKLGLNKFNYNYLMRSKDTQCKVSFLDNGRIDEENTDPLILKYMELSKKWHYKVDFSRFKDIHGELLLNAKAKQDIVIGHAVKKIREELNAFENDEWIVVDKLVKFLYEIKPTKHKHLLWCCYGERLYKNLVNNYKPKTKYVKCKECGEWFEVNINNNRTYICDNCKNKQIK